VVDKKELQEARAAGQQVLRLLDQVEGTLRKARNWGFFDLVSKRSLFSSLIKFEKIIPHLHSQGGRWPPRLPNHTTALSVPDKGFSRTWRNETVSCPTEW
jgi:hypothetical protein